MCIVFCWVCNENLIRFNEDMCYQCEALHWEMDDAYDYVTA